MSYADIFSTEADWIRGQFVYTTDLKAFGRPERWTELRLRDGCLYGDCEDFCITLARLAHKGGVPLSHLILHVVAVSPRPDHLIISCEDGVSHLVADCNKPLQSVGAERYYDWHSCRRLSESSWIQDPLRLM